MVSFSLGLIQSLRRLLQHMEHEQPAGVSRRCRAMLSISLGSLTPHDFAILRPRFRAFAEACRRSARVFMSEPTLTDLIWGVKRFLFRHVLAAITHVGVPLASMNPVMVIST